MCIVGEELTDGGGKGGEDQGGAEACISWRRFLVRFLAFYGWVGFLHLGFWRIVLAFVIWPYYIGARVSALVR